MIRNASYWIENLDLKAHQEGGYYKSIYTNPQMVSLEAIGINDNAERSLATSIFFLLNDADVSKFHRLKSDEMWYYHDGLPLNIYVISPEGELRIHKLGLNIENGELPQVLVPAGTIFGSSIAGDISEGYSLVGCMVSFGFDFRDFELFTETQLMELYPQHSEIIKKLT